jgi:hypothetical protein
MSRALLAALAETLLPAEADPPPGSPPLPGAAAAGIDLAPYEDAARPVLALIEALPGGGGGFVAASSAERAAIVEAVEQRAPEMLRALLAAILPDYYEASEVLLAFGWRAEPPQPRGHTVIEMDEDARAALERVRWRGKISRDAG